MSSAKRTKIVCTIGPASRKPDVLFALVRAGMNVARLNFSHGTRADHALLYRGVRAAARRAGEPVAVLADLQGPKIRLGELPDTGVGVKTGETVTFTTAPGAFHNGAIPVAYANLHKDVKPGHRMLIEDGLYEAEVLAVKGRQIRAKMKNGGRLLSHKGLNFPDSTLRVPALTAKDRVDAAFAAKMGADWVALSFVTSAADVRALKRVLAKAVPRGTHAPRVMVKIEKHEAVDRFEEILEAADGVMVARGDLGVEIPPEDVPIRQKAMIELCRLAGKPVVVATQMLDSMIRNPRPTRAEVSDVANAVFDHADATMLSGETATGAYPVEAVSIMARIIREAEASPYDDLPAPPPALPDERAEVGAARALRQMAADGHIDGVLATLALAPWSETLHRFHPEVPLFLAAPDAAVVRQNNVRWGVSPFLLKTADPKTFVRRAVAALRKAGKVKAGMRLAAVLGAEHGKGFDLVEVK